MLDNKLLKIIDWENDNGVAYGMINDHIRSQFYDTIFKGSVEGKHCIDIGSGTGLLSMLALKHNAKHVTAFEANTYRYQLLVNLVEKLGLQDKITVVNELFTKNSYASGFDVIIHEIIGDNIWNEGIIHCLHPKLDVLPSVYCGEFFLYEISDDQVDEYLAEKSDTWVNKYHSVSGENWPNINRVNQYNQLPDNIRQEIDSKFSWELKYKMDVGVDINPDFVSELQQYIDDYCVRLTTDYPITVYNQFDKEHYNNFITRSTKVFEYEFNTITKTIISGTNTYSIDSKFIEMRISKSLVVGKNYLLLPRFSVKHNKHILYLTDGHWTVPQQLVLINNVNSDVVVRQYFDIDSGLRVYLD
jgi:hypothetical protein